MGFVKSFQEIMANARPTADFYKAEMLTVFWETKPEIVARLLPPPLKPAERPIAMAFVADYPATNFDVVYKESALFVRAVHNGEEGGYCLAMPVTNDIAMAAGREFLGFPKKMADIYFKKEGASVEGWTERRGIRFMHVRARLTGKFNDPAAQDVLTVAMKPGADGGINAVSYNFKHFPAPEGGGFDYNPRLVKQETVLRPREMIFGEAEIDLRPSAYDPWAEVEVVRLLGALYTRGDNSMLRGKAVAEAAPIEFAPYAFLKWDMK
ncbi:MAG TPA: acetoacetate decarboxylase family protein [Thermodesulfobacteriota bacterium]|nr:acetoacetate decarboxylase family protein [Thermodesulfobacteriota bacterium]